MNHNWSLYFDTSLPQWRKLQELYKKNDKYPKIVVRGRELHHKFLRCFSRLESTEIDNDKENLVSLSCGEHFLAHYYLWKCTNTGFRRYTCQPIFYMYKKSLKFLTDEIAELIAVEWAKISADRKLSEEHKAKISKANKGKRRSKESKAKMSEAWDYDKHFTAETRKKMSTARKGKYHSKEWNKKISKANKGKTSNAKGRHWKLVDGKRVYFD